MRMPQCSLQRCRITSHPLQVLTGPQMVTQSSRLSRKLLGSKGCQYVNLTGVPSDHSKFICSLRSFRPIQSSSTSITTRRERMKFPPPGWPCAEPPVTSALVMGLVSALHLPKPEHSELSSDLLVPGGRRAGQGRAAPACKDGPPEWEIQGHGPPEWETQGHLPAAFREGLAVWE